MSVPAETHLRVARPTNDIEPLRKFYSQGLGFKVLYEFKDHDGFDGLMLGLESAGYHLEFTKKHGHDAGRAPSQDNLLVFYIPDEVKWRNAISRMESAGFSAVPAFNAYWDRVGKTFEDPDGYRVVFQNAGWSNDPQ